MACLVLTVVDNYKLYRHQREKRATNTFGSQLPFCKMMQVGEMRPQQSQTNDIQKAKAKNTLGNSLLLCSHRLENFSNRQAQRRTVVIHRNTTGNCSGARPSNLCRRLSALCVSCIPSEVGTLQEHMDDGEQVTGVDIEGMWCSTT